MVIFGPPDFRFIKNLGTSIFASENRDRTPNYYQVVHERIMNYELGINYSMNQAKQKPPFGGSSISKDGVWQKKMYIEQKDTEKR